MAVDARKERKELKKSYDATYRANHRVEKKSIYEERVINGELVMCRACSLCGTWKPISDFKPDRRTRSGISSWCKPCAKTKSDLNHRKYRSLPENKQKEREYHHARYLSNAEELKSYASNHRKENAADIQAKRTLHYAQNEHVRLKTYARNSVQRKVREGLMPKVTELECIKCGLQAVHYHHHNGYDKQHIYDVVPVCAKCHAIERRKDGVS